MFSQAPSSEDSKTCKIGIEKEVHEHWSGHTLKLESLQWVTEMNILTSSFVFKVENTSSPSKDTMVPKANLLLEDASLSMVLIIVK